MLQILDFIINQYLIFFIHFYFTNMLKTNTKILKFIKVSQGFINFQSLYMFFHH